MKLVGSQRAVNAFLGLGVISAEQFGKNLENVNAVSSKYASSQATAVLATDADRVSQAFQKVKDSLTTDLGEKLVGALSTVSVGASAAATGIRLIADVAIGTTPLLATSFAAWALGLKGVAAAATQAQTGLTGAAATAEMDALLGVKATLVAKLSFSGLGAAGMLRLLGFAGMGIGIGALLGQEIKQGIESSIESTYQKITDEAEKAMAELRAKNQEALRQVEDSDKAKTSLALKATESAGQLYNAEFSQAKSFNDGILDTIKKRIASAIEAHQGYVRAIESAEKKTLDSIQATNEKIESIQDKRDQNRFNRSLENKSGEDQITAFEARAKKLADEGEAKMKEGARTGNAKMTASGEKELEKAEGASDEAASLAKKSGDEEKLHTAWGWQDRILNQHEAAEEKSNALSQQRLAALDQEKSRQQQILGMVQAQGKVADDNLKITNADGSLKNGDRAQSYGLAPAGCVGRHRPCERRKR